MKTKPKIAPAAYVRVSTQDQNLRLQKKELSEFCARRGWAAPVFFEEKAGGAKAARTVLDQLLTAVRSGKFRVVIVWKLDRLGRSLSHLLNLIQEFKTAGVGFVSTTQGIDTTDANPMGGLLLHIIGAFAEFERELILERTRAGMRAAARAGRHAGRPRRNDAALSEALKMRAAGLELAEISKKTGLSKSYVSQQFTRLKKAAGASGSTEEGKK